jgi:hypothetical protein
MRRKRHLLILKLVIEAIIENHLDFLAKNHSTKFVEKHSSKAITESFKIMV